MTTTHLLRVAGLVAALLCAAVPKVSAEPSAPFTAEKVGVKEQIGARLPLESKFITAQGKHVTLGQVLDTGKPTLLVLAYSRCSMLCSLVLRSVSRLLRESKLAPGTDFTLVTLSIDPRDTKDEAARTQHSALDHAGYPSQVERWTFLVGSQRAIDAVASAVGFRYSWDDRTEQYAHPAVVFAVSPSGELTHYFYGLRLDPASVERALAGENATTNGIAAAALNCFRFDSVGRRYGKTIERSFQLGSALVLLIVVVGLGLLFRRGRVG
jgi:protein SCO1/2